MKRLSRAAVLAVGSELLTPLRIDTNSLFITEQLNLLGIDVVYKSVVGDDRDELANAMRAALGRTDLVVCSGGLGPTDDDVTREVAAAVLARPMSERESIVARIRARFSSRGLEMPEINRRQAMVPAGAEVLENAHGTAPGLWLEAGERVLVLLPGPPRELEPMLIELVSERLRARSSGAILMRRVIRITGRTESHTEEAVRPLYARWSSAKPPIAATILAAFGEIELHVSARESSRDVLQNVLEAACAEVSAILGQDAYSTDGRHLEEVLGGMLAERGLRVGLAESCTGGLTTSRLTDVPGSSRYIDRAVVTYSNDAKTALLGVPAELIERHGAVSETVAVAMADAIRTTAGLDLGIGITGIAGPGGGSAEKPVGTVAIAVATAAAIRSRLFRFAGGREQVKFQASQAALDLTRRMLLDS